MAGVWPCGRRARQPLKKAGALPLTKAFRDLPPMPVSNLGRLLRRLRTWRPFPRGMLVYVDVRNMRNINRFGLPNAGDRAIREVQDCLEAWAGPHGIVERLWSNEFVAACAVDNGESAIDAVTALRRQLTDIHYPSALGDNRIAVSIGIQMVHGGVTDWRREIAEAGIACDTAKQRGLNQIITRSRVSDPAAASAINSAHVVNFRRLRSENRLTLHAQPIMDISGARPRLAKAEFLIRMEQQGRYLPLPGGTIETLEALGLSTELDAFSVEFVLQWLQQNPAMVEKLDGLTLNLSARSIADGQFMERLLDEVRAQHLPPGKLGFEITETAAIDHLAVAAEWIEAFDGIGCFFSLDDFGSGLCSFGYLHSLPVREVKIDGRFIRDIVQDSVSQEIVRAVHQVARAAGKKTVAEFVDDPRKLAVLQRLGVDYAQGWLFYPALPPERLLELIPPPNSLAA